MTWKELTVSSCHTFHKDKNGKPAYSQQFDNVLAFHSPGIAPVSKGSEAWHIHPNGKELYTQRYLNTFGFYCDRAAVVDDTGWFHINTLGQPIYSDRFLWCGNFQSDYCTVCDTLGNYFHIDVYGRPIYKDKWQYCGDYREGIAVIQNHLGLSSHIDINGNLIHEKWFDDLDVFHKGYARAKTGGKWQHINHNGDAIYEQKYSLIEPFYNGLSRVESESGERSIINETGETIRTLRKPSITDTAALSSKLVGFWKTLTIGTGVELGIFENLPSSSSAIAKKLDLHPERLTRLLNALAELNTIEKHEGIWHLNSQSKQLCIAAPLTLADAALEYKGDMLNRWKQLPNIIRGEDVRQDIFQEATLSQERLKSHHRMLHSYAMAEYPQVLDQIEINHKTRIFDAAGGTGALACLIKEKYPTTEVTLGELPDVLSLNTDENHIHKHPFDLHKPWDIKSDCVLLAKVIHDWNDKQAVAILKNAYDSLSNNGQVVLLEMLVQEKNYGGALCDLHLLAVTGGQERSFDHYKILLEESGFTDITVSTSSNLISVICAKRGT